MEVADRQFVRGLDYLLAARRIDTCKDTYSRERLAPLAAEYRQHAHALMAGVGAPADQD